MPDNVENLPNYISPYSHQYISNIGQVIDETAGVPAGPSQSSHQISIAPRPALIPSAPPISNYTNEGHNRPVDIIDDPPPPYPGPPPGETSL